MGTGGFEILVPFVACLRLGTSLNQMLGRTLITSITTLLVLLALLIFGGDAIQNFSIALIIGVIAGTYSSIYVVCNTLISLNVIADDLANAGANYHLRALWWKRPFKLSSWDSQDLLAVYFTTFFKLCAQPCDQRK